LDNPYLRKQKGMPVISRTTIA